MSTAALLLAALLGFGIWLFAFRKVIPPLKVRTVQGQVSLIAGGKGSPQPLKSGTLLRPGDVIQTGKSGVVDLQISGVLDVRAKEGAELASQSPGFFEAGQLVRAELKRGTLLVVTAKEFEGKQFELASPQAILAVRGTAFRVEATDAAGGETWVGVARGEVAVRGTRTGTQLALKTMERTSASAKRGLEPAGRVSYEEWKRLVEVYELYEENPLDEKRQEDLSRRSGTLFLKAIDHATFFTPGQGFLGREFLEDESGRVILKMDYDVTPPGSFVGLYVKTRDLDLSRLGSFSLQVKGDAAAGYPKRLKVEFKTRGVIMRTLMVSGITSQWQAFRFPLRAPGPVLIDEVTLVVWHDPGDKTLTGRVFLDNLSIS